MLQLQRKANTSRNLRLVFTFFLLSFPSWGFSEMSEMEVNRISQSIFSSVNSPYCPGRLLQNCPSLAASELKEEVRDKLRSGKSEQEVRDDLYANFGDSIQAAPDMGGFGLVGWVAPFLFLFTGLLVLLAWLRLKKRSGHPQAEARELSASEQKEVEAALREFER